MTDDSPLAAQRALAALAASGEVTIDPAAGTSEQRGGGVWHWSNGADTVTMDASGRVLAADLPANSVAARTRLIALLLLLLYVGLGVTTIASGVGAVFHALLRISVGSRTWWAVPAIGGAGSVLAAVYVLRRLGTLEAEHFAEPLRQVAVGRWEMPRADGAARLARVASIFVVLLAGWWVLENRVLVATGATPNPPSLLLALGAAAALFVTLRRLEPSSGDAKPQPFPEQGPWVELVTTALLSLRYVIVAAMLVRLLGSSGVLASLYARSTARLLTPSELMEVALQLAVIAAVVRSKLAVARWPAALGLLAGFAAERAFGLPGKLLASFAVVVVTVVTLDQQGVRKALRVGLRFELGTAVGRVGGRLVTGLLLGPAAVVIGEALGEQLAGSLAVRRALPRRARALRMPAVTSASLPAQAVLPSPVARRWPWLEFAGAGVLVAAALSTWAWNHRVSTVVPMHWQPLEREDWRASFPGPHLARQRSSRSLTLEEIATEGEPRAWIWSGELPTPVSEADGELMLFAQRTLRLEQVNGFGHDLLLGITETEDIRCVVTARPRGPGSCAVVAACTAVPEGMALSDDETAFFASVRVLDTDAPAPLVTRERLSTMRSQDVPQYFQWARDPTRARD